MSSGANGFAGALFFALAAIGIVLSVEGVIGWIISAVCAVGAAISLRQALMLTAEANEEDHQRIEIQFQQLRNKVSESSSASSMAMHSITETTDIVQENLDAIRSRLGGLDNLMVVAETTAAMGAALKSIEDNTRTTEKALQSISAGLDKNFEILNKLSEDFNKHMETLCSLGENNKTATQTGIKLMQVFGQILKSPGFAKDIGKLAESADILIKKSDSLDELKNILSESKIELSALSKAVENISNQNSAVIEVSKTLETSNIDSAEKFNATSEHFIASAENLSEMFDEVRKEISALTKKIEAYNGLTKATLEQYSNLTEQDIRILEKIAGKVNG